MSRTIPLLVAAVCCISAVCSCKPALPTQTTSERIVGRWETRGFPGGDHTAEFHIRPQEEGGSARGGIYMLDDKGQLLYAQPCIVAGSQLTVQLVFDAPMGDLTGPVVWTSTDEFTWEPSLNSTDASGASPITKVTFRRKR